MTEPHFAASLRRLIERVGGDASRVEIALPAEETDAAAAGSFEAHGGVLTLRGLPTDCTRLESLNHALLSKVVSATIKGFAHV